MLSDEWEKMVLKPWEKVVPWLKEALLEMVARWVQNNLLERMTPPGVLLLHLLELS